MYKGSNRADFRKQIIPTAKYPLRFGFPRTCPQTDLYPAFYSARTHLQDPVIARALIKHPKQTFLYIYGVRKYIMIGSDGLGSTFVSLISYRY